MLDFFNDLSAAVTGTLDRGSILEVNTGLRERFARIWLDTTPAGVRLIPELHPDSLAILAWDSPEGERPTTSDPDAWRDFYEQHPPCVTRLVTHDGEGDAIPALIGPEQKGTNAQKSWHSGSCEILVEWIVHRGRRRSGQFDP